MNSIDLPTPSHEQLKVREYVRSQAERAGVGVIYFEREDSSEELSADTV